MPIHLRLSHGRIADLLSLQESDMAIELIANSLSKVNRFCGHAKRPYSVAAHSVLVSQLVSSPLALHGLLHDATEAYVGDVTSPVKAWLRTASCCGSAYDDLEARVASQLARCFGYDPHAVCIGVSVSEADAKALVLEQLLLQGVESQVPVTAAQVSLALRATNWDHETAKAAFLARFAELRRPAALACIRAKIDRG